MLPSFVVSSLLLVVVNAQTTCPYDVFTPDNTFCKPPNKNCTISNSGVSDSDIQIILDTHNSFRNTIALGNQPSDESGGNFPQAANMVQLAWDKELASIAQKLADQCRKHGDCAKCREVSRFSWVGQNIYRLRSSGQIEQEDWKKAISDWYKENKYFPVSDMNPFQKSDNGHKTGHFTQVVWGTSQLVGCGWTTFNNMLADKDTKPYAALAVCNYGPGGNTLGDAMYDVGSPATACPQSYTPSTQYPGLCTNN